MCQLQEFAYIIENMELIRLIVAFDSAQMQYQYCILRRSGIAVENIGMQL
jgi:hypothetical protein